MRRTVIALRPKASACLRGSEGEAEAEAKCPAVRPLTDKETQAKGRGLYRNKFFAGTLPWHRSLRDANLCNGNLFKSFTDIQAAPAKGAGRALQRNYNSMDDRIGPFGVGWTHAYDIRTEEENRAGGRSSGNGNKGSVLNVRRGRLSPHDIFWPHPLFSCPICP